jgi:hypothetical protein
MHNLTISLLLVTILYFIESQMPALSAVKIPNVYLSKQEHTETVKHYFKDDLRGHARPYRPYDEKQEAFKPTTNQTYKL